MSGNLFSNLLSLHTISVPEEDFFTELVAWFLDKNPDTLFSFIHDFLKLEGKYSRFEVETQVEFYKLEDHLTGSRPDILISMFKEEETDFLIIESKLGSREGNNQLSRYAEQLNDRFPHANRRYLVYLTRDDDPKDAENVTNKVKDGVIFKQFRWQEFYNFLRKQPPSNLLEEILEFMRIHHMAEITRINPSVLAAINLFPDVYSLFHTVLDGEVENKFSEVFGSKSIPIENQYSWRSHALHSRTPNWEYFIGFWMPETSEDYPMLYASLQITPNRTKISAELAKLLMQIEKDTINASMRWKGQDFNKHVPYIELTCYLNEIINAENHIIAMKKLILGYLNETDRIFKQYPFLQSCNS